MIAVYAQVNRTALELSALPASLRFRAAPLRSLPISRRSVVCGRMRPMRSRFSRLIEHSQQQELLPAHDAGHEAAFLQTTAELRALHDDRVDFAAEAFVQRVKRDHHLVEADVADHHQINVAGRPFLAPRDRAEYERQ